MSNDRLPRIKVETGLGYDYVIDSRGVSHCGSLTGCEYVDHAHALKVSRLMVSLLENLEH